MCVHHLLSIGYNVSLLSSKLRGGGIYLISSLTVPHPHARIKVISTASMHGGRFHIMSGGHKTQYYVFKAAELNNRKKEEYKLERRSEIGRKWNFMKQML